MVQVWIQILIPTLGTLVSRAASYFPRNSYPAGTVFSDCFPEPRILDRKPRASVDAILILLSLLLLMIVCHNRSERAGQDTLFAFGHGFGKAAVTQRSASAISKMIETMTASSATAQRRPRIGEGPE